MGILDEISSMKSQGMQEREILEKLQEKGVTPKSIEEAFNQMKIKKAVSAEGVAEEGMEPSIMKGGSKYESNQTTPLYTPKTHEIEHNSEGFYTPQPEGEIEAPRYNEYEQQEEYAPREGYEETSGTNYDTDTFIEIAEQVFLEKIKKEQKQITAFNEFATLAETKISDNHERIKRIESMIDKLQIAILEKIGSYGRNLDSIKNEMGMMQESFEKMIPSVHERNYNKSNKEKNDEEPMEKEFNEEVIQPLMKKKISKKKE